MPLDTLVTYITAKSPLWMKRKIPSRAGNMNVSIKFEMYIKELLLSRSKSPNEIKLTPVFMILTEFVPKVLWFKQIALLEL